MEAPEIWVVVPASRPEMAPRVMKNFARQRYENKRLLVVENGDAVGAYLEYPEAVCIQSERSHSLAKNAGLDWLCENRPGAYWAAMDDDDYYGDGYLTEHAELGGHGKLVGKHPGWVKFDSGLYFFCSSIVPMDGRETGFVMGGTMGGYASEVGRFADQPAEEKLFCDSCVELGLSVETTSRSSYCYSREGDPSRHVWQATDKKFWRKHGGLAIPVEADVIEAIEGELPTSPVVSIDGKVVS